MSTDAFGDMFAGFNDDDQDQFVPQHDPATPPGPPAPADPPEPQEPYFASIDDMLAPPEEPVTPPAPPAPAPQLPPPPAPAPAPQPSFNQFDVPPVTPPSVPPNGDPQQALKEEFMRRLTSGDPTDAFMFAAQIGAEAAVARLTPQIAESKGSTLLSGVENFKRSMEAADPKVFKAVQKDFDSSIGAVIEQVRKNPQAVATITEQQVLEACQAHYERAKGRALDRLLANSRKLAASEPQPTPPAPSPTPAPAAPRAPGYGGRTGAPAPGAPQRFTPKNAKEQEVYDLARAAGLSDEDMGDIL